MDWHHCRFGMITLDGEAVTRFKEANDAWLKIIDGMPFNVIYVDGEPTTSLYGGGVKRLISRLKRVTEGSKT
jgi:hypothetical protein